MGHQECLRSGRSGRFPSLVRSSSVFMRAFCSVKSWTTSASIVLRHEILSKHDQSLPTACRNDPQHPLYTSLHHTDPHNHQATLGARSEFQNPPIWGGTSMNCILTLEISWYLWSACGCPSMEHLTLRWSVDDCPRSNCPRLSEHHMFVVLLKYRLAFLHLPQLLAEKKAPEKVRSCFFSKSAQASYWDI